MMDDDPLIGRVRKNLVGKDVREQKMFGGTCFMLSGNMLVGVSKRGLLVRVGKDAHGAALARPHTRPMEMTGRMMEGFIFVAPEGTKSDKDLKAWIGRGRAYVDTLPPKDAKAKKPAAKKPSKKAAKSR
jgi:TfoX N-terminal domain